jgi:DNA-binding CsgD family transcriptional regulator
MCSGLSIADAAKKQFITDRSAYNVIRNVRTKVGASSNEHLVVIALTEGWLKVDDDGKVTVATAFNI